ncbi:MAG: hypothetical protein R3C30_13860 [Hyphomonadaceae bacterium]
MAGNLQRLGASLLVLSAAACAPALPSMSAEEANTLIQGMSRGGAPVDVCTSEGQALFRSAVRTHARAMHDAGEAWPNFEGLEEGDEVGADAVVVALGLTAGHIEPGDLQGEARGQVQRWALNAWPQLLQVRAHSAEVCNEMVAVRRAGVRFVISRSASRQRELERALQVLEARLTDLGVDTRARD